MRIFTPFVSKTRNCFIYLLFAFICFNPVELHAFNMQTTDHIELTPEKAKHIINTYQNLIILDLRNLDQFNEKHILGAISIPLSELNGSFQKLDKKFSILVYALDNNETSEACKLLRKNGFKSLFSLNGGLDDLKKSGVALSSSFSKRNKSKGSVVSKSTYAYKSSNYCNSSGGDTSYEYIQGVTTSIISEGVMAITVEVFIANPDGCTSGSPCESYDASPEYVNAWIDWNGNDIFDANEKVINAALTGYSGINFRGTMSTSTVVNIPQDAVGLTWIRVNLGWDYDPNDPCDSVWDWGNVIDREIIVLNAPPEIEDITIVATGDGVNSNYPLTKSLPIIGDEKIIFVATIKENESYEITEINWDFDTEGISKGDGNPYECSASAGTHGNRKVTCNLISKHKSSGTISKHEMTKEFKLFFAKDTSDNLITPNWFRYWNKDGAVPGFDDDIIYLPYLNAYGVHTDLLGLDKVGLTRLASGQHYGKVLNVNGNSFGGPTVTGIDCAAEVIAHEKYHQWVARQWKPDGIFINQIDSDKDLVNDKDDMLPDFYENTVSKTLILDTDSYDMATIRKHPPYSRYGDQEYMCMVTGNGKKGFPEKDWSYPGKQTASTGKTFKTLSKSKSVFAPSYAQFTNTYTDEGIDNNSNGSFDFLRVSAELDVSTSGTFYISAKLNAQGSSMISYISEEINLNEGIHVWTADFDGVEISEAGIDGPYTVTFELSSDFGDQIDYEENAHTTSNYNANDFKTKDARFTDNYTDEGLDLNADLKYDSLNINVEVNINTEGTYTVEGGLYDENGSLIETVTSTLSLSTGIHDVTLAFDGKKISAGRFDGPYYLKYLGIAKEETLIDFRLEAYTTSEYSYLMFQSSIAMFDNEFNFEGFDTDDDVKFNYLRTIIGINVESEGQFKVLGSFFDSQDNFIVEKEILVDLSIGENIVNLDFDGKAINAFGIDGPYVLKSLFLIDLNGSTVDYLPLADTTQEFLYSEFQQPDVRLVTLTGNYEALKTDVNSTCTYDFLTIKAQVDVSVSGNIVTRAILEDSNNNEISVAENIESINIDNGTTQYVTLNFDGLSIYEHGINGPYSVKNLYIYHTGDPTIPDFNEDAFTTQSYRFTEYDAIPGLEKPIIDRTDDTLASNISGSNYEWFLDNTLISGANQQTYIAEVIGNYQVKVIDEFGCTSSLSDNLYVGTLSSTDAEFAKNIVVYPNPSDGILKIKGVDILETTIIQLFDITGKLLFNKEILSRDTEIDITNHVSGMYFMVIEQGNKKATFKVVKQ